MSAGRHDGWSEERIALLRQLWEVEELPTTEIGQRLGLSKNAVVGKAHRLKLTPRPSPIHASGTPRPPRPSAAVRRAAAALPPVVPSQVPSIAAPIVSEAVPVMRDPVPVFQPRRSEPCRWQLGSRRQYRSCDAPSVPGRSYCAEHQALACRPVQPKVPDPDAGSRRYTPPPGTGRFNPFYAG